MSVIKEIGFILFVVGGLVGSAYLKTQAQRSAARQAVKEAECSCK